MKSHHFQLCVIIAMLTLLQACKPEPEIIPQETTYGHVNFRFDHYVDGQILLTDTLLYTNAAGNEYLVNEIQYFISDIVLTNAGGTTYALADWIHYVDTDIPDSRTWTLAENIPSGTYASITFCFGIIASKNLSNMFSDPPERDMFWPEYLGGGYHYMKLNGQWKDTTGGLIPFNFHLGIGQTYAGGVPVIDSITGFVQNYFTVTIPGSGFFLDQDQTREIQIIMNVDSWFETPNVWDHNVIGGFIMQNQAAMNMAKENGYDVFSVGYIN